MDEKGERLSVVDRYYTRKYKTDILGHPSHDQCILLHSNKVCVVTVAKSHPILAQGKTVRAVDYGVEGGVNRMNNKVSGKGKKGAQKLKPDSVLCSVTCDDGSTFPFVSCVKGVLIEVNENLIKNPQLITEKSETNGYLAIILLPKHEYAAVVKQLETEQLYLETLETRKLKENGASDVVTSQSCDTMPNDAPG